MAGHPQAVASPSNFSYPATIDEYRLALDRRLKGNLIHNGAFQDQLWQRGTSFASGASKVRTADRWEFLRTGGVAGGTLSRQTGTSTQYAARIQRDAANASTAQMNFTHTLESITSRQAAGLPITVQLKAKAGANFSPTSGQFSVLVYSGTGTDENLLTGFTGATLLANQAFIATGSEQTFTVPVVTPGSAITQLGVYIIWVPTGTAGAADYLDVAEVQMVIGGYAGNYPYRDIAEELDICRRFYNKSFLSTTTPVQNAGVDTGEFTWAVSQAGATNQRSPQIQFGIEMRTTPTITLFNPAAANAQVRDKTAAGDCTAAATYSVTRKGFGVTATGNAGGAIAGQLGVHWTAEAEL